ncbi:hypothetical protein FNV43_RR10714 [Rhamnella rubrinervis]|uniref:Uncharacterized protein n=1 Tax=Rhamnella rubrinervis TaxID=2594499 RepID=A0A8K0MH67_9ROSA|nr:hypothetical protein FNV43_RR10714 [Rhamnella rubrinervis]
MQLHSQIEEFRRWPEAGGGRKRATESKNPHIQAVSSKRRANRPGLFGGSRMKNTDLTGSYHNGREVPKGKFARSKYRILSHISLTKPRSFIYDSFKSMVGFQALILMDKIHSGARQKFNRLGSKIQHKQLRKEGDRSFALKPSKPISKNPARPCPNNASTLASKIVATKDKRKKSPLPKRRSGTLIHGGGPKMTDERWINSSPDEGIVQSTRTAKNGMKHGEDQ